MDGWMDGWMDVRMSGYWGQMEKEITTANDKEERRKWNSIKFLETPEIFQQHKSNK